MRLSRVFLTLNIFFLMEPRVFNSYRLLFILHLFMPVLIHKYRIILFLLRVCCLCSWNLLGTHMQIREDFTCPFSHKIWINSNVCYSALAYLTSLTFMQLRSLLLIFTLWLSVLYLFWLAKRCQLSCFSRKYLLRMYISIMFLIVFFSEIWLQFFL